MSMSAIKTSAATGFDPQQVPVIGSDGHLPAVPAECLSACALRSRFARPPQWQVEQAHEAVWSDRSPTRAAVLLALLQGSSGLSVLLTQRSAHLATHAAQIAFPGGKIDPEDADALAAALREAHEEVGMLPHQVEVLGELPVYATGSGFHITPVVALVHAPLALRPNPQEVDEVFDVPLDFLMNPAHHRRHAWRWQGHTRHWFSMPYLQAMPEPAPPVERYIWGATAGMLRNFYRFLSAEMTHTESKKECP